MLSDVRKTKIYLGEKPCSNLWLIKAESKANDIKGSNELSQKSHPRLLKIYSLVKVLCAHTVTGQTRGLKWTALQKKGLSAWNGIRMASCHSMTPMPWSSDWQKQKNHVVRCWIIMNFEDDNQETTVTYSRSRHWPAKGLRMWFRND